MDHRVVPSMPKIDEQNPRTSFCLAWPNHIPSSSIHVTTIGDRTNQSKARARIAKVPIDLMLVVGVVTEARLEMSGWQTEALLCNGSGEIDHVGMRLSQRFNGRLGSWLSTWWLWRPRRYASRSV